MAGSLEEGASRRERQIMDIIYRRGQASAEEVLGDLPDPPSYSAARALLRILEEKGQLVHEKVGARYVYRPARSRDQAGRSALKRVLNTFFEDSTEKAVAALLDVADARLSPDELGRLLELIEDAQKEGR